MRTVVTTFFIFLVTTIIVIRIAVIIVSIVVIAIIIITRIIRTTIVIAVVIIAIIIVRAVVSAVTRLLVSFGFTCRFRDLYMTYIALFMVILFRLIVLFLTTLFTIILFLFVRTIWILLFMWRSFLFMSCSWSRFLFYFLFCFLCYFRCFRFLTQLFFYNFITGIIYRINCFRNIYIMLLQNRNNLLTFYAELFGDFMDALFGHLHTPLLSINLFYYCLCKSII